MDSSKIHEAEAKNYNKLYKPVVIELQVVKIVSSPTSRNGAYPQAIPTKPTKTKQILSIFNFSSINFYHSH